MAEKAFRFRVITCGTLLVLSWYCFPVVLADVLRSARITFYNIGQGDAIHISLPEDFDMLIDGGPDNTIVQKLGEHLGPFNHTIELVVLTHMDADHIAGFIPLLDHYHVNQVLWNGEAAPTSFSQSLLAKIQEYHVPLRIAHAGDRLQVEGATFDVLNAGDTNNDGSRNDGSIVLRATIAGTHFLFTGDLEQTREKILLTGDTYMQSDILKIGHHGSRSSTSLPFLISVDPMQAIISAGKKNRYGHPHQETLDRLKVRHVRTRTTFEEGDITYLIPLSP